jgi:ABC-type cobalamin/Fe3+-siderophores transport system ATPase subunit
MTTIHVKHIGPIVDSGEVRVTPVTLLIGKQSSGKSTLMKLLCYAVGWRSTSCLMGRLFYISIPTMVVF